MKSSETRAKQSALCCSARAELEAEGRVLIVWNHTEWNLTVAHDCADSDGPETVAVVDYCPWCGTKLQAIRTGVKTVTLPNGATVMLIFGDVCHPPDSHCKVHLNETGIWYQIKAPDGKLSDWRLAGHRSMMKCMVKLQDCKETDDIVIALEGA